MMMIMGVVQDDEEILMAAKAYRPEHDLNLKQPTHQSTQTQDFFQTPHGSALGVIHVVELVKHHGENVAEIR